MTKIAKPLSRKSIRKFTDTIREICDRTDTLEFPIIHFLENIMPLLSNDFEYDIVEDHELDCEARAFPESNKILIRESVYDGAYDDNPRDLFTIAHEIGHMFLHREDSISFARGKTINIKPYENPEWQANTFAGELLAPVHLIKGLRIEEISEKCKVSRQVAEIQKSYCN